MKLLKKILKFSTLYKLVHVNGINDFVDTLNYRITPFLLCCVGFLFIILFFYFPPIWCYVSNDPGGNQLEDFVNAYCFMEGTIPFRKDERIPETTSEWSKYDNTRKIVYYQWLPFIPLLKAVLMLIPHLFWKLLISFYQNNSVKNFIVLNKTKSSLDDNSEHVNKISKVLENLIFPSDKETTKSLKSKFVNFIMYYFQTAKSLFINYTILKILYTTNTIFLIWLMNRFLLPQPKYREKCGFPAIKAILTESWRSTNIFPRVGMCYVPLKNLGASNYCVAQCSIKVNLITELYYITFWIYFIVLFSLNLSSLTKLIIKHFLQSHKSLFINRFLQMNSVDINSIFVQRKIKAFEKILIEHDGLFLLDILLKNAGPMITGAAIKRLWLKFRVHDLKTRKRKSLAFFKSRSQSMFEPRVDNRKVTENLMELI